MRESQKAKEDRAKIRRRTHKAKKTPAATTTTALAGSSTSDAGSGSVTPMEVDALEDEATVQQREREKIQQLVKKTVGEENMQPGTNWSGLYELSGECGCVVSCASILFRGSVLIVMFRVVSYCHSQRTVG